MRSDGASFAGELEVRFADGVREAGLYTRVNGKPLIVIDAKAESNAAMRSTVIHELVHFVENKEGYKALADYVMKTARPEKKEAIRKEYVDYYAENKIDYTEADLESEVVASLVGERLQSEKFLKRYAEKDASVLKKAQSFIKELKATLKDKNRDKDAEAITAAIGLRFDRALAGGETRAAGETVKKYQPPTKQQVAEWEKPITIQDVETLRSIGRKSINEFTSEDIEKAQKWSHKFYKELGVKSPFFRAWFGEWRAFDHANAEEVNTKADARKEVVNSDTKWIIQTSKKVHKETSHHSGKSEVNAVKYLPYIDDITQKAVLFDSVISDKDNPNSLMFHTMYAYTEVMGYPALLKLKVEELFYYNNDSSGEITRDYILQNIEEESISKRNRLSRSNHSDKNSSVISISDLYDLVKTYDKDFVPAPEVSEHVLNDDGTPKVFYHGTRNQFTTFELQDKPKYGRALGDGFYFTPDYDKAFKFANGLFSKGQDRGGIIMPVYLRMQNPYVIQADADRTKWMNEYRKGDYDGIVDLKNDTHYVENPEQIKSATDNIGTFDKKNPDIRYALKKKKGAESGEAKFDEFFAKAEIKAYEKETRQAQNTAEAFKEGNKILNRKLEESRAETERYKAEAKSLARQIAQDAYEEDAKIFTEKEIDALIGRIGEYSTDKFRDIMNEKDAKISKADKEQFAYDIYVAFHVAAGDKRAKDRIRMFVDRLAHQYLDNVYFVDEGKQHYYKKSIMLTVS